MAIDFHVRPNRVPWPPLIYVVAVAAAIGLGWVAPLGDWPGRAGVVPGWVLGLAGVGLDLWAMATMARARTNILPHRGADRLVSGGPFAFTRNPIYVGNTLLVIGIGLAISRPWIVVAAFAAAAAVDRLAIRREEVHLALKFGEDWRRYAAATPRWLGWPMSFG